MEGSLSEWVDGSINQDSKNLEWSLSSLKVRTVAEDSEAQEGDLFKVPKLEGECDPSIPGTAVAVSGTTISSPKNGNSADEIITVKKVSPTSLNRRSDESRASAAESVRAPAGMASATPYENKDRPPDDNTLKDKARVAAVSVSKVGAHHVNGNDESKKAAYISEEKVPGSRGPSYIEYLGDSTNSINFDDTNSDDDDCDGNHTTTNRAAMYIQQNQQQQQPSLLAQEDDPFGDVQALPTTSLQRSSQDNRFPSAPGAFRAGSGSVDMNLNEDHSGGNGWSTPQGEGEAGMLTEADVLESGAQLGPLATSTHSLPSYYRPGSSLALAATNLTASQRDGLAVANPISDEFSANQPVGEAKHVDPEEEQYRRKSYQQKSMRSGLGMIVITCILLTGSILAVVLVTNAQQQEKSANNNKSSSSSGVMVDQEGTLSLSDHVESFLQSLPNQTIQAIIQVNDKLSNDSGGDEEEVPIIFAQARAFRWLVDDPNFVSYPDWRKVQRFALATFYLSMGGFFPLMANETGKSSWLQETYWLSYEHHECEWFSANNFGATDPTAENVVYGLVESYPSLELGLCDYYNNHHEDEDTQSGRVERLVMLPNRLMGTLPPELFLLTSMRIFATIANGIHGSIPSEIGLWTNLEFFGAIFGAFSGSIPSQLALAKNLTHLMLFRNRVSGSIPTQIGSLSNIKGLMLDANKLDGTLPTELGLLSNAIWVSSYENAHTGTIPSQLGHLSSVRFLGIFDNPYMPSTMPSELGLLLTVQELNVERSNLMGAIPTQLGQLRALEKLYLPHNNFSGRIPSELSSLPSLWYIDVGNSNLSGTFPRELLPLTSLRQLLCYGCQITGTLPTEIALMSSLETLRLTENELTGQLPSELGLLRALKKLRLKVNNLSGVIPSELSSLDSLNLLTLSNNTLLSGALPPRICSSSSLYQSEAVKRITIEIDCDSVDCGLDDDAAGCHCKCNDDNRRCECGTEAVS